MCFITRDMKLQLSTTKVSLDSIILLLIYLYDLFFWFNLLSSTFKALNKLI